MLTTHHISQTVQFCPPKKTTESPVDSIKIRMYSKSKKADQDPFINTEEEQGEVTLQNTTQPTNTDSPGPKVKVIFVMYIRMIIFPQAKSCNEGLYSVNDY
jgi:hypothetical protein